MTTFTAFVEWDPATKQYAGTVPSIPGAHTQGATLDELRASLKEVVELCLAERPEAMENAPTFIGLLLVEVHQ